MSTTIQIVRTVIDGAMGEITVTHVNTGGAAETGVRIQVDHGGAVSSNAAGHLAYIPSTADGGYDIGTVNAGDTVVRTFAVKPVDAEAGKTYQINATVVRSGGNESATADIFVEARPEVYAAIGLAETIRAQALDFYNNAKQKGRQTHEGTALPETRGDPTSRTLQPSSFQWAMQIVELGTKMFTAGGPPRGSGEKESD